MSDVTSDITIVSGGSFALETPLTTGTNIEFLNNAGNSGTLTIAPSGFEIVTQVAGSATLLVDAGIDGQVQGFVAGDTIILDNLETLYARLDVGPGAAQSEAGFDSLIELEAKGDGYIQIAPGGSVTGTFSVDLFGTEVPFQAEIPANIQSFIYGIEQNIFGPAAANETFTINFATAGQGITDGVIFANSTTPCFAAGTRILTMRGEIAVESLEIGDEAVLAEGGTAPIRWIGHRDVDFLKHPAPHNARPVRIAAGALGVGVPADELVLSPDHALFFDGALVQAKDLIDGVLIRQDKAIKYIRYYHVELPEHGILLANSTAAESYLDTGHRGVFGNTSEPIILHQDIMQSRREAESTAPLVTAGSLLTAIRARLHAHKLMLGYMVNDVALLGLQIGDSMRPAAAASGSQINFTLPEDINQAVLATPVFVPAEIDPGSTDRRVLGVALADIWLDGKQAALESVVVPEDMHERSPGDPHIWTRGSARLNFPPGTKTVLLGVAGTARAWHQSRTAPKATSAYLAS